MGVEHWAKSVEGRSYLTSHQCWCWQQQWVITHNSCCAGSQPHTPAVRIPWHAFAADILAEVGFYNTTS